MKKLPILITALLLAGCLSEGQVLDDLATPVADPEKVPVEITLYDPVPVLAAKFEASESGYTVTMYRTFGAPSSTIDQNRDVRVQALDAQGTVLSSVTVDNPRDVHTVGASEPDTAVLPVGTFTVFFADPLEIRALKVEVINGVNSGLEQSFEVEPKRLKQFDIGEP